MIIFKNLKKNYLYLLSTFLILYFFVNLLDGERGLFSLINKKKNLDELLKKKNNLSHQIADLELKNSLLSNYPDKDYVEILIRDKFLFGKNNDRIYIIKE